MRQNRLSSERLSGCIRETQSSEMAPQCAASFREAWILVVVHSETQFVTRGIAIPGQGPGDTQSTHSMIWYRTKSSLAARLSEHSRLLGGSAALRLGLLPAAILSCAGGQPRGGHGAADTTYTCCNLPPPCPIRRGMSVGWGQLTQPIKLGVTPNEPSLQQWRLQTSQGVAQHAPIL